MLEDADAADGGLDSGQTGARRYRAPALEKGLDVLELLTREPAGLMLSAIVARLGRSQGELFRMVQVLHYRGYIEQSGADGAYRLTDKLFALGMEQPKNHSLVELSLPVMRRLALTLGQSCHLAYHSAGEIVVVARMESAQQIGFSVRIGYRRPTVTTASGVILFAHQSPETQTAWRRQMSPTPSAATMRTFSDECAAARRDGFIRRPSPFVDGVIDLSAPIMRGSTAAAALTVPFLMVRQLSVDTDKAGDALVAAAREISEQLAANDNRA